MADTPALSVTLLYRSLYSRRMTLAPLGNTLPNEPPGSAHQHCFLMHEQMGLAVYR